MDKRTLTIFGVNVFSYEKRSDNNSSSASSTVSNPSASMLSLFGGMPSKSGVRVTEYTALNFSAVYRCIDLISGHIAYMPLSPYKKSGDLSTIMGDHSTFKLLRDNPFGSMTAFQFKKLLQVWILTHGNAYAYIQRDGVGRVTGLIPIHPNQIFVQVYNNLLSYHFTPNGFMVGQENIPSVLFPWELLHFKGLSQDGVIGRGVIQAAKETIGLGMAAEEFASRFYSNGANSEVVITSPTELKDEVYNRLNTSFKKKHSGLENSHNPMILEAGMEVKNLTIPPEQAQFLQSRQFQVTEICRWFGVPPHKVGDLERSTNNNIEHQGMEYYTDTLVSHCENWEAELKLKLLSTEERKSIFYNFDANAILRGDTNTRMNLYKTLWNIGGMTANEAREREGMNPTEGGDRKFIPVNTIPLDMAGENIKAKQSSKNMSNGKDS